MIKGSKSTADFGRRACLVCGTEFTARVPAARCCSRKCTARHQTIKKQRAAVDTLPVDQRRRCLICGEYYRKVGSHIWMSHGMRAKDYRIAYQLPYKRGILAPEIREKLAANVRENRTIENLRAGRQNWFVKGEDRTKGSYKTGQGWKGKRGKQEVHISDIY